MRAQNCRNNDSARAESFIHGRWPTRAEDDRPDVKQGVDTTMMKLRIYSQNNVYLGDAWKGKIQVLCTAETIGKDGGLFGMQIPIDIEEVKALSKRILRHVMNYQYFTEFVLNPDEARKEYKTAGGLMLELFSKTRAVPMVISITSSTQNTSLQKLWNSYRFGAIINAMN